MGLHTRNTDFSVIQYMHKQKGQGLSLGSGFFYLLWIALSMLGALKINPTESAAFSSAE